jgi:hypothetical protein
MAKGEPWMGHPMPWRRFEQNAGVSPLRFASVEMTYFLLWGDAPRRQICGGPTHRDETAMNGARSLGSLLKTVVAVGSTPAEM